MVRPRAFGFHAEAATSNAFAQPSGRPGVAAHAMAEFDMLVETLDRSGVEVIVLHEREGPDRPDAVFPNNWTSFHADGTVVLYPMATEQRRLEPDTEGLLPLLRQYRFLVRQTVDLTHHAIAGRYLEGTGSLVFDRPRHRAFASRSVRTDPAVVAEFDRALGYSTLLFDAVDRSGQPIYHTNVFLSVGSEFAILCSEVVPEKQRKELIQSLERTVVEVSYDQMQQFACNGIELRGRGGTPLLAMSTAALSSLMPPQIRTLERFAELVASPIPTIEEVGGGSVRCMIADVHLPRLGVEPASG